MRCELAALVDPRDEMLPRHEFGVAGFDLLRSPRGLGGPELVNFGLVGAIGVEAGKQARRDHRPILRRKRQGSLQRPLSGLGHAVMVPLPGPWREQLG
jgi:hypothetical protein